MTTWRELKPVTAELFRCDLCGEQATTIHLVPWCDQRCEQALLACERHDPGGYWFPIEEYLNGDMREHLEREQRDGVYVLMARVEELAHPVVEEEVER